MKKHFSILIAFLLTATLTAATIPCSFGQAPTVEELWINPMEVIDLAVSKDGNYIVAVNETGLYYFTTENPDPLWWFEATDSSSFTSVAVSANGNYVVAGNATGYIAYFTNAQTLTGSIADAAWWSNDLGGSVEPGTLDISDNGEYVVVGGTGENLYYFAGCTSRSGIGQSADWSDQISGNVHAVDMSSDGRYVVAGSYDYSSNYGYVAFYKDANTPPYPTEPDWLVDKKNSIITDVAVSDDGYAVAAASTHMLTTVYYWADATTLTDSPGVTWSKSGFFSLVDMSANGDNVIAVGAGIYEHPFLHFWSEARSLTGTPEETWTALQDENTYVDGAAISDDGSLIVATASVSTDSEWNYNAYFFTSDGTLIGNFILNTNSPLVSISGDGSIVAIGGPGWDSIYVFKVTKPPVGGIILPTKSQVLHISFIAALVAISIAVIAATKIKARTSPL